MKTYFNWAVYCLCLTVAICCDAADIEPIKLDCDTLKSSAVSNIKQRVEIVAQGFSVLPPQGERWCYRPMGSDGGSFFKIPKFDKVFESLPSQDEIAALHMFSAMAISLKGFRDFRANIQSSDELKTLVHILISEHLFSQILEGVISAEHRFRLVESKVAINDSLGASCVRMPRSKSAAASKRPLSCFYSIFPLTQYAAIRLLLRSDLFGSVSLSDTLMETGQPRTR